MNLDHTAARATTYYPAVPGARTLADARDLVVQGGRVTAEVAPGGGYTVFSGLMIIATGRLDGTEGDLNSFFAAEALAWDAGVELDRQAQADADIAAYESEVTRLSRAVVAVRERGAVMDADADEKIATIPDTPVKVGRRGYTVSSADHRHPLYGARSQKREAAVLMAWTEEDENGYKRYVSDGIGDTDGWYTPLDRFAWKR